MYEAATVWFVRHQVLLNLQVSPVPPRQNRVSVIRAEFGSFPLAGSYCSHPQIFRKKFLTRISDS
jgi:hypothetical protein